MNRREFIKTNTGYDWYGGRYLLSDAKACTEWASTFWAYMMDQCKGPSALAGAFKFVHEMHRRNIILKARQLGFSDTFIMLEAV